MYTHRVMIKLKMMKYLNSLKYLTNKTLSRFQFSFRWSYCTIHWLRWRNRFFSGKKPHYTCAFLDKSRAFDWIRYEIPLYKSIALSRYFTEIVYNVSESDSEIEHVSAEIPRVGKRSVLSFLHVHTRSTLLTKNIHSRQKAIVSMDETHLLTASGNSHKPISTRRLNGKPTGV